MWSNERRAFSSYLGVDTSKDKYRLLNPTPLEFIAGYIMEDAVSEMDLKRLPQRILNLIYGSISSFYSILNSPEQLYMIKQANKFASVLGGI